MSFRSNVLWGEKRERNDILTEKCEFLTERFVKSKKRIISTQSDILRKKSIIWEIKNSGKWNKKTKMHICIKIKYFYNSTKMENSGKMS